MFGFSALSQSKSAIVLKVLPGILLALLIVLAFAHIIYGSYIYSFNGQDFTQDWVAVNSLIGGGSLYGRDFKAALSGLLARDDILNNHPPSAAWFYIPFALLNFDTAAAFLKP